MKREDWLVLAVAWYVAVLAATCEGRADVNDTHEIVRELAGIRRALESAGRCK